MEQKDEVDWNSLIEETLELQNFERLQYNGSKDGTGAR